VNSHDTNGLRRPECEISYVQNAPLGELIGNIGQHTA
jgi:hypothetical protein